MLQLRGVETSVPPRIFVLKSTKLQNLELFGKFMCFMLNSAFQRYTIIIIILFMLLLLLGGQKVEIINGLLENVEVRHLIRILVKPFL